MVILKPGYHPTLISVGYASLLVNMAIVQRTYVIHESSMKWSMKTTTQTRPLMKNGIHVLPEINTLEAHANSTKAFRMMIEALRSVKFFATRKSPRELHPAII